jgi:hypothetical protein
MFRRSCKTAQFGIRNIEDFFGVFPNFIILSFKNKNKKIII